MPLLLLIKLCRHTSNRRQALPFSDKAQRKVGLCRNTGAITAAFAIVDACQFELSSSLTLATLGNPMLQNMYS